MVYYDNIWLRYNYMKIWNLRVQKNLNIEKMQSIDKALNSDTVSLDLELRSTL